MPVLGLNTIQQSSLEKIVDYLDEQLAAGVTSFPVIPYSMFFGFDLMEAANLTEALRYQWENPTTTTIPGHALYNGFADEGAMGLTAIADAVTQGRGGGLSAFSAAKYAIQQDSADVNILVIGDSTGNESTEWVYLFAQWLGAQYPTHTVKHRAINTGTYVYDAAVTLTTGSGSRTITFYNASVAGAVPYHLTDEREQTAVADVPADLIIFNHGHNSAVSGLTSIIQRGQLYMGLDSARLRHPNVPVVIVRQNPRRDDDLMAQVIAQVDAVGASYSDATVLDAYSRFTAQGKASSLYTDNQHPSASGTALFLEAATVAWSSAAPNADGIPVVGPHLGDQVANLIPNGDFSAWTGALPDNWTSLNGGSASKELSIVDGASAYSAKVVGTTAGARIMNTISGATVTALRGQKVTLAVRLYVPTGAPQTVGRVGLRITHGPTTSHFTQDTVYAQGGFRWAILTGIDVDAAATSIDVFLLCDGAANASSAAYYDRAILVAGEIPRDMA